MEANRKYFCLFWLIFALQILNGQELSYEQYTDKDGLPSMKTYDIIQDSSGLLWIGTENGLVSFDGEKFVRFSSPGLEDNDIVEIAINRNGKIFFINLSRQLSTIENNQVFLIDQAQLRNKVVYFITKKHKDYVYVYTDSRIKVYEMKEISSQIFDLIPTDITLFNKENHKTYKWIASSRNYFCIEDSTLLTPNTKYYRSYSSDNKNYVFTDNVISYEISEVDENIQSKLLSEKYTRFVRYKDDLFIIKNRGITYYDSKTKSYIPFLDNVKINTIFLDVEGVAWISTPDKGLLKISNLIFKLKQEQTKLEYNSGINDIYQDRNGNVYLGSIFSEVIINPFRNSKKIKISSKQRPVRFSEHENKILAYDEKSILVINSDHLQTEILDGEKYKSKALLIANEEVFSGTVGGILQYDYSNYFNPNHIDPLKFLSNSPRFSNVFKQEITDDIFAGSIKGLYRLAKDSFEVVENDVLKSINVSSIIDGDDNSIWVGTRTNGVFNVKNDSIINHFNNVNGLISDNINHLAKTSNELLISTNAGLCIVDLSTNVIEVVNEYNFLPSNEVLVCKVINGKYWIGTINGLTILSKEDLIDYDTKNPMLSLKNLVINGVNKVYVPGMTLDHTDNNLQLNLQNISFKSGREKQIKYRIPFIDTTWTTTSDPNLRLPSLMPGNYHIEAIGINSIGLQSKPLNLYFKIDQAWWNTLWAKISALLILFGVVYLIFAYRAKRIRKEEKIKRDYLSQINLIKEQALQLQMNPHFIFNSLNAIQGFIGTDDEEMAMNYLARFARLIRLIFEHSKGNTITLEEELEFINLYLDLEKLRFKDKINYKITVNPEVELAKDIMNIPPLLIQPIVENSFKHGLFHKKGPGNLSIDYSMKDDMLQVIIQDDGIGRVHAMQISQKNSEKQISSGIKTTLERIDLLNFGKNSNLNTLVIEDLYDTTGNAAGTKTTLTLSV
jgi:ligand-binding sensor domain-containing protein